MLTPAASRNTISTLASHFREAVGHASAKVAGNNAVKDIRDHAGP